MIIVIPILLIIVGAIGIFVSIKNNRKLPDDKSVMYLDYFLERKRRIELLFQISLWPFIIGLITLTLFV